MCGLVAVVLKGNSGFTTVTQKVFEEMLFMDALRGPDSTGTFLVDKGGDVTVIKDSIPSWDFLCTKSYLDNIDKPAFQSGKALVGHNRKATMGKVNAQNSHPFTVNKELVLVHNGTLPGHKHLGDTEVDSEAIAQYIHDKWDEDADADAKAKVLAHIGGAWALIWYDTRTNVLNFVRNNQRPLCYAETTSEFFFSSEAGILEAALSRNSVKNYTIKEIPAYTVFSFNLETLSHTSSVKEVVLSTDHFFPKVTTKTGKSTEHLIGCTTGGSDQLSKNAFKKFVKNIVGRTIDFYVEDFVDLDTISYHFYGQCFNYSFNHEILGVADTELVEAIIDNYNCATGEVIDATYNSKARLVSLRVKLTEATKIATTPTH